MKPNPASKPPVLSKRVERTLSRLPTLAASARTNPAVAERIDARVDALEREYRLEREIERAMERRHVNRMQLAALLGKERSSISRDLNRGLARASLERVRDVVHALDHELIPVILPRNDKRGSAEELRRMMSVLDLTIADLRRVPGHTGNRSPRRRKAA
jgi:hypothetical protein